MEKERGAFIQIWNSSKNFFYPRKMLTGTMPWMLQTFEFQSLPNSNPQTTYFNLNLLWSTGTAWFDGITLEEIK